MVIMLLLNKNDIKQDEKHMQAPFLKFEVPY